MITQPSSLPYEPKAAFLGLPLELRQQIYHEYFKVDGGYVYDGDFDRLVQADGQPISISLRYACRSVAEETKSFPFKLNSITFSTLYRKDLQHQAAIHSNLIRFHTLLLSGLLIRMRRCITPEMFDQVEEAVKNFDDQARLTGANLSWNDSTVGFQRAIVCMLRQINFKCAADTAKAIDEILPGWGESSSPGELFDLAFDHWDIPSLPRLREAAERLQRHRFLESLGNWHEVQSSDARYHDARYKGPRYRYRRKYWFSATAVAIRFLNRLSSDQRRCLHKLVLDEDRISVGFPESHAMGMIPFCKENPRMHLEQRVDVWNNLVMSSERPTAYMLPHMYFERSEPKAGELYFLDEIDGPDQDSYFTNWVVHGMEVVRAGMPVGSWSVVFDGSPDLNLATDLFTTLLRRTIVWQTFYSDCVSLGLYTDPSHPDYPFATIASDERPAQGKRSSIFQCNFNLDRPWNLDEIAANHNVHKEACKWKLYRWVSTEVNLYSEPIAFRILSSTVDLAKLRLNCFERQMIAEGDD
ncbi:hypothetical protein FGADI_1951 [Fusarium gaditjirri]|uniref:Uncharacterized protein n=1 Tax=Fusarium gaditjirri TaxID=282569 RepID=A0A8H4X1W9_9HYPO|nr:hypothetical protein FGADI_1951 [Fusarium gaditjirri]